jgi:hypothetical protein
MTLPAEREGEGPQFVVEPPDKSPATEIERQFTFRKLMRQLAPTVMVYANTNGTHIASLAGRRKADREGRMIGVPDVTCVWNRGIAWIEFKAARTKPTEAQVEFMNRLADRGHHVACFRSPMAAVEWVASLGAPVRLSS